MPEDLGHGVLEPVANVALPDPDNLVAELLGAAGRALVAVPVPVHLLGPEAGVRAGEPGPAVVGAAVPEAAVDEHSQPVPRQDEVGSAALVEPLVQAVAQPCCEQGTAQA